MRSCSLKSIAGWAVGSPFGDCVTRGSVRRYSLGPCEGQGEQNDHQQDIHESDHENRSECWVEHRERGFRLRPPGRSGRRKKRRRRPLQPPTLGRPSLRESSGSRRGESGPAERGRAGPPPRRSGPGRGWAAAGRRSRATATQESRRVPSAFSAAKRRSRSAPSSAPSSALRRRIFAEAAALMSARPARKAPAAGGLRHT
jgi:hypothetical protein